MLVNFVLPTLNASGGVKVVKDYCYWLNAHGHDCYIYYPLKEKLKHYLTEDYNIDYTVPYLRAGGIRDADVTLATAWDTAQIVRDLPEVCGVKAYFIQHYEKLWDGRAEKTYDYPLKQLCVSRGLADTIRTIHGTNPLVVENGIRLPASIYKNVTDHRLRILMPYRQEAWKGTDDGLDALEQVREQHPECRYGVYGWRVDTDMLPEWMEVYERYTDAEVRDLYYKTDIFLNPSTSEGFNLPSLEAMAYMCAVVTTNTGAVPEYTDHGFYAFVVTPYDVGKMAEYVTALIEDKRLRVGLQYLGYEASGQWRFEHAAERFESCLKSLVPS